MKFSVGDYVKYIPHQGEKDPLIAGPIVKGFSSYPPVYYISYCQAEVAYFESQLELVITDEQWEQTKYGLRRLAQ